VAAVLGAAASGYGQSVQDSFLIGGTPTAGEYTQSSVAGQNPTGLGFAGAWELNAGSGPYVSGTGLTYSDGTGTLVSEGGSLVMGTNNSRAGRPFAAPLDHATSGTYYLSFVYKQASDAYGYRGIGLFDGSASSSDRVFSMTADGSTNGQLNFDVFGDWQSNLASIGSQEVFVVMRFDMSTTAGGDIVTVYLNPSLAAEPTTALYSASGFDVAFDRIGIERWALASSDRTIYLDEIRMGQTYADVSPTFSEGTVDSFLLGGDASAGEYTESLAGGQDPLGTGFAGPWEINSGGGPSLSSDDLGYSDGDRMLITAGGSLFMGNNNSRGGRPFTTPLDDTSSGTHYLSFVYKQMSGLYGYRGVGLFDGSVSSSDRVFMLSMDSSTDGQLNLMAFGDSQPGIASIGYEEMFFVLRFDMSAGPGGDAVTVYLNPDLRVEPTVPLYSASGLDISFDRIGIERWTLSTYDRAMHLDEIRTGSTYDQVTPEGVVYAGLLFEDDFDRVDSQDLGYTPDTAYPWVEQEGGAAGDGSVQVASGALHLTDVDAGGSGTLFYPDRNLDAWEIYDIELTVDLTAMTTSNHTGSGLWLLPRAEGSDFPGNRGWFLRVTGTGATESLSVFRYDGGSADGSGNLAGTSLTPSASQRLDRDKPADIRIEVTGDFAFLTVDQSPYGGPSFTTPEIDLGSVYDNGTPDVFLMGAHQVQSGSPAIDATIDDLTVGVYAGGELSEVNVARANDWMRAYGILLDQPAPSGLDKSGGKGIYRAARDAYLRGDDVEFHTRIDELEVWFASVAAWYEEKDDLTHRVLHGQSLASAESHLQAAASLLSAGQTAGVEAELDAARAIKDGLGAPPTSYKSGVNRWGWIKTHELMGYRKHPDEGEYMEPTPWLAFMKDTTDAGRSSLLGFVPPGPGYSYRESRTVKQIPFTDVRFHNVPNNHQYTFTRDWTTTRWEEPNGRAITFSVLTPLMFQENTDRFYLQSPDVSWVSIDEDITALWLKSGGQYTAVTTGTTSTPSMDSPTAILETSLGYYLVVVPESIDTVTISDEEIEIVTDTSTNFALMKLTSASTPSGNPGSYPDLMTAVDFWTEVALDAPVAVAESIQGSQVTMTYSYLTTPNAFGASSHRIAPVPPLAVLADLGVPAVQEAPLHMETNKDYGNYEYVDGNQVTYTMPSVARTPLHGANIPVNRGLDATDYAELASYGVRVARLYPMDTTDPEVIKDAFETALQLCRDHGIKAIIDPHTRVFSMSYNDVFPPAVLSDYIDWWVELAQVSAPYQDVILGYDFYNEPPLDRSTRMAQWVDQAEQVSTAIQAVDPNGLHYVSAISYGGPGGLYHLDDELPDPLMRPTYHIYTPYSFTHQKVPQGDHNAPNTWYPDWVPGVDHGNSHYGYQREPTFYDKWNVGAVMMPAFEYAALYNAELLVGEFSPLGYTRSGSEDAAAVWNSHITDWASRYAFDTTLWAYHGSGLEHPEVKAQMLEFWGYNSGIQLDASYITPYGINQNGANGLPADFTLSDGGRTITLTGNSWFKYELPEDYTVTSNTMLQVTFSSSAEGELHGIGLDEDNDHDQSTQKRSIILHGTQYWNRGIYLPAADDYSNFAPDEVTYTLDLGNLYSNTGPMPYLIFINDGDVAGGGVSTFRNIRVYEE